MEIKSYILQKVPHLRPYRFVDHILEVDEEHIVGTCFLAEDSFFYQGHFPKSPITPGFIVTEIMAQIGVLCLGLYLVRDYVETINGAYLTTAHVKFHQVSYPNDTIMIHSKKAYFRFNTLRTSIEATNQKGELICSGTMAGMIQ